MEYLQHINDIIPRNTGTDVNVNPSADKEPRESVFNGTGADLHLDIDPSSSSDDNIVVIWAAFNNHPEVIETLLKDPKIDPSINNNCAITWAVQKKNYTVVELLIKNERVFESDLTRIIKWKAQ